jgi:hypothetical protein
MTSEPASADVALFRVQQTGFGAPFPAVTPGGAGRDESPVRPYKPFSLSKTSMGATGGPGTGTTQAPGVATVTPSNNVGAAFTLQKSFIQYKGTITLYPSTAFKGYLSKSLLDYVNGEGRFRPNNPYGATTATTVDFYDNYTTATTTHGGLFGFSRNGYINIDPGPNRFGGTMRILYAPTSGFYQYISYFNPIFFKAYGSFACTKMGATCTEGFETGLGEVTSSGMVSRFLLGAKLYTYPTPTVMGKTKYRKIESPPAISKAYYLHLNVPWTTGKGTAYGVNSLYSVKPAQTGYDKAVGGSDITLTRTETDVTIMKGKTYYPTKKYYTKLTGVTRVVSMVRPRLTHGYTIPRVPTDPIFVQFQANRLAMMKVFFLPEPGSMLLIASGIVGVAGLALLRRR